MQDIKQRDVAMMSDSTRWPQLSILPLTRECGENWPELGFLVAGKGPVVFLENMHMVMLSAELEPQLKVTPKQEFVDFEAVFDAGWMVD